MTLLLVLFGGVIVGFAIGFWACIKWMSSSEMTGEHDYLHDYPEFHADARQRRLGVK
jgi:hypothetical protein